ncbi:MAG: putative nucleotidyltransferase [Candidatus Latescibacterota bacterium]|jgi:predicted nucleotidyltransferase
MIEERDIRQVAEQLGRAIDADAVILFGSHARGDAGAHSDVDLLIVAESDQPRFKRSRKRYESLRPYPFGMDLVVYTPDEIEKARQAPHSFVSTALNEGKTILCPPSLISPDSGYIRRATTCSMQTTISAPNKSP